MEAEGKLGGGGWWMRFLGAACGARACVSASSPLAPFIQNPDPVVERVTCKHRKAGGARRGAVVSVLKELLQIIRNEQLSVLVSTFRIQGTLKHHVIFIFAFSSAGSIVKRPAMITDPLHPSTGFKIYVINSNLPRSYPEPNKVDGTSIAHTRTQVATIHPLLAYIVITHSDPVPIANSSIP